MKLVIHLLSETRHTFGRKIDDNRSIVQSIPMACLPPPNFQGKKPSDRAIAAELLVDYLNVPTEGLSRLPKHKRALLESSEDDDKETSYSQVLKSKGRTKVNQDWTSLNNLL